MSDDPKSKSPLGSYADVYVDYLAHKIAEADWHAVADAANDLRELEAEAHGRAERPKPAHGVVFVWEILDILRVLQRDARVVPAGPKEAELCWCEELRFQHSTACERLRLVLKLLNDLAECSQRPTPSGGGEGR